MPAFAAAAIPFWASAATAGATVIGAQRAASAANQAGQYQADAAERVLAFEREQAELGRQRQTDLDYLAMQDRATAETERQRQATRQTEQDRRNVEQDRIAEEMRRQVLTRQAEQDRIAEEMRQRKITYDAWIQKQAEWKAAVDKQDYEEKLRQWNANAPSRASSQRARATLADLLGVGGAGAPLRAAPLTPDEQERALASAPPGPDVAFLETASTPPLAAAPPRRRLTLAELLAMRPQAPTRPQAGRRR